MKRSPAIFFLLAGLLVVVSVAIWLMTNGSVPAVSPAPPSPAVAAATPTPPTGPVAMPAPELPPDLPPPQPVVVASPEAVKDIEDIQFMLRDFRAQLGGNPSGTNAEIMRAVMGRNPAHATLGPREGQQLNDQGELLDRWGSPYFFHQLSSTEMEVRSAGPDRQMYTPDDVVRK